MLRDARERYDVGPVVEVIQPAVRTAMSTTRNGRVGVIGTAGTIGSRAYQDMLRRGIRHLTVFTQACPRFVEFVEAGITARPGAARRRRGVPGAAEARRRRHARARLHPLPVPRGRDQLCDGPRRHPRLQRHRDRVRTSTGSWSHTTCSRAGCRAPTYVYEATGDSADEFLAPRAPLLGPRGHRRPARRRPAPSTCRRKQDFR